MGNKTKLGREALSPNTEFFKMLLSYERFINYKIQKEKKTLKKAILKRQTTHGNSRS